MLSCYFNNIYIRWVQLKINRSSFQNILLHLRIAKPAVIRRFLRRLKSSMYCKIPFFVINFCYLLIIKKKWVFFCIVKIDNEANNTRFNNILSIYYIYTYRNNSPISNHITWLNSLSNVYDWPEISVRFIILSIIFLSRATYSDKYSLISNLF